MRGKFVLEIDLANAAFGEDMHEAAYELEYILLQAADKIVAGNVRFPLRDSNGNTVGTAGLVTN